jgi:hypothetical protein
MLLEIVPQRVIEEREKSKGSFRNISFWRLACVNDVPVRNIDALSKSKAVGGLLRKLFGAHVCRLPRRISARSKHVEVPNDELTTSFPRKSKICKSFLSKTPPSFLN